ncbi:HD domain-containing protein [Leptospira kirschneri]|uniref:HD domain-containing protein n=1 Tax=Leptospira kirschneri TaxID=29507 RepID=UPI0035651BB0
MNENIFRKIGEELLKNIRICPDNNVGSVQGKNPLIEAKTNNVHRFLQLWGKADRDESQNLIWHPLAYHMLDVAAVAWVWLQEGYSPHAWG